jgi:hypothetical protein
VILSHLDISATVCADVCEYRSLLVSPMGDENHLKVKEWGETGQGASKEYEGDKWMNDMLISLSHN